MRKEETRAAYPLPPRRPERPEEQRWPSPTPQPVFPAKDSGRVLKQILNRLDSRKAAGNNRKTVGGADSVNVGRVCFKIRRLASFGHGFL